MAHVYSDAEMLLVAKLSYMDIPEGANISEWLENCEGAHAADVSGTSCDSARMKDIQIIREIIANNNIQGFENWRVVDVCNKNAQTGFHASVFDTGSGDAIIGFRGSEKWDLGTNTVNDWVASDFGLLDSTITPQQANATDYMRYIYEKYGEKYDSFSMTGHSLGGNLAQHALYTAPEGMVDKIDHAINFDGPGFSDEYLRMHRRDTRSRGDKASHFEWSLVGSLLNHPEETDDRVVNAQNEPGKDDEVLKGTGIKSGEVERHDIKNMYEFMEDGYVTGGERGNLQKIGYEASKTLDNEGINALIIGFLIGWDYSYIDPVTRVVITETASLVLVLFYPVLHKIHQVHQLIYNAHGVIKEISRAVQEIKEDVRNFVNNIYRNYIAPSVSGEFEADRNAFDSAGSRYVRLSNKIDGIIDQVENIELGMAIKAHSSRVLQTAVFSTKTALEIDNGRLKTLNNKLSVIYGVYADAEEKVVTLFE